MSALILIKGRTLSRSMVRAGRTIKWLRAGPRGPCEGSSGSPESPSLIIDEGPSLIEGPSSSRTGFTGWNRMIRTYGENKQGKEKI